MLHHSHPYLAYKPSGVPWLGDVPWHWEVRRTKTVLEERSQKGFPQEPLLAATQTKGVVRKEEYENRTVLALKDLHLLKLVRIGDFVISLRSFQGGIEYAREQGIISPAYTVLYPKNPDVQAYLALLFKSQPYVENLTLYVTGIRQGQNIDYTELSRSYLPLPPLAEQQAIVGYLDYVDRRIRRYVGAKRKLIALLEEEKHAVVNRAVSCGLDPNVRLKPSGVEWLGDVPEHWEVRRLRSLASIGTGGRDTINREDDGKYPFFVRSQSVERINTWSFDGEAVLTAGDGVGVGKVFHYINGKFDYHQRVYKLSNFRHVVGMYFFHYFRSTLRNEVFQGTAKSTVDSLRLPMLQNFPVALPPLPEQHAIVENLEGATVGIDTAIGLARRQIELMEEYRTRLIADVITGKLDVREAATQLPDEDGDHDPIEESAPLADGLPGDLYDIDESVEDSVMEEEVTA